MVTAIKASAAAATLPTEPVVAGEIILLPVDDIDLGERLRPVDRNWAQALGGVMAREGQQTPIEVSSTVGGKKPWRLVAGAHRLVGAQGVGMELIEARVVSGSEAHRRLREVSENLWRRGLDPIDRAAFIAELVTLHKLRLGIDPNKDGRSASIKARWQKAISDEAQDTTATIAVVYGWSEEVGERLGLSARTVRDDLMLFRRILPSLIASLRQHDHPAAKQAAQLRQLSKLEASEQEKVVQLLVWPGASLGYGQPRTVAEAIALNAMFAGRAKPKPDAEAKRLSAFLGSYQRMSLAEKKGALEHLRDLLPAGFTIEVAA